MYADTAPGDASPSSGRPRDAAPGPGAVDLDAALRDIARQTGGSPSVALVRRGSTDRPELLASSGSAAADLLRMDGGGQTGPIGEVLDGEGRVTSADLRLDDRWLETSGVAVAARAVLVLGLPATDPRAAVVIASGCSHAFDCLDHEALSRIRLVAAMAVELVTWSEEPVGPAAGGAPRHHVGSAIGIVMAHHLLSVDQAFEALETATRELDRPLPEATDRILSTAERTVGRREARRPVDTTKGSDQMCRSAAEGSHREH